jgi:RNA 3'-terminal phosphate cyclase (ATP)
MPKTEVVKAETIRIDGSFGEGGGQILRSSLSLSLVTGKPFRIENIRANRQKPGLLRQHLTAVQAAAEVGSAEVDGASLGSKALTFVPCRVRAGEFRFAIGTAGSGTLVLQTILPALITADGPSRIEIEGGTHNPAAPPFDFLQRSFLPLIERMGPKVKLELERYGFYPAGGGRIVAEVIPTDVLKPIELDERGEITTKRATALVANLPYHIARRELITVGKQLNWDDELLHCEDTKNSVSPGNLVMIELASSAVTEIVTAFGKLGVSAEDVAKDAAEQARAYMHSSAAVGEHLADQLLLPLALAGGGSFSAVNLNMHAKTNMDVIRQFLPVNFQVTELEGHNRVSVGSQICMLGSNSVNPTRSRDMERVFKLGASEDAI